MRKLFVPFVAMATVLVFTSCGGITFTGLEKDLTIDLGDRTAALDGVSAKGKKDIPKEDITIVGLDFVGVGELTYTAKEDSETGTDTRKVSVKPDKLFNEYAVVELDVINSGTDQYNVEVKKSTDALKLLISNFLGMGYVATFGGVEKSMTLKMEELELDNGAAKVNGTAKYHTENGYEIYEAEYEVTYSDGSPADKFKSTLRKR